MAYNNILIYLLIAVLISLAVRILMALAVEADCRAKNIKEKTAYTVLTFFFPVIVGIVYACTRNSAKRNTKVCAHCNLIVDGDIAACPSCQCPSFYYPPVPEEKQLVKKSMILFAVAAILYVGTQVFANTAVSYLVRSSDWLNNFKNGTSQYEWFDDFDYFDDFDPDADENILGGADDDSAIIVE